MLTWLHFVFYNTARRVLPSSPLYGIKNKTKQADRLRGWPHVPFRKSCEKTRICPQSPWIFRLQYSGCAHLTQEWAPSHTTRRAASDPSAPKSQHHRHHHHHGQHTGHLNARLRSKHFRRYNSFNPCNHPRGRQYYLHFTDKLTEAQRCEAICQGSSGPRI